MAHYKRGITKNIASIFFCLMNDGKAAIISGDHLVSFADCGLFQQLGNSRL
jgi:hypothetical protein